MIEFLGFTVQISAFSVFRKRIKLVELESNGLLFFLTGLSVEA